MTVGFVSTQNNVGTLCAQNVNFTNQSSTWTMLSDGQLIIGHTALNAGGTHIDIGKLTSPSNTIQIGYSNPNITLDAAGAVPGVQNLGISLSGTTFTVNGANGTALSSSNPAYVTLQSLAHPGQLKTYKITTNQSFTQAQLGNNLFGVTTAVNITTDMPFYLYAVSNANNGENTIAFMISRIPQRTTAPVAGNIGQSGNTNATTQGSFYSLPAITAADYASAPCLCIGSFRQRYSSSLWTVQTINNSDGIGQYQEGIGFSFPPGQFGAASGKYFLNNGGTAPDATTKTFFYFISKNGKIDYWVGLNPINVAGVGSVALKLAVPLQSIDTSVGIIAFINDATNLVNIIGDFVAGFSNTNNMVYQQIPGQAVVLNTNLPNNATFSGYGYYYSSTS